MKLVKVVIMLTLVIVLIILTFVLNLHGFIHKQFVTAQLKDQTFNQRNKHGKESRLFDNMEMYLRMTTSNETLPMFNERLLVQSLRYFWPDNPSIVVVLDNENLEDHAFGDSVKNQFPYPRVCFMDEPLVLGFSGKDRMQRDMFYPEMCTSNEYVAYVETDAMFITRVIPEVLFEEGKPVIIGIYGYVLDTIWESVARSTFNMFKTKEVIRCLANYPVIFKVEHIIQLRRYLENLHNMTLDSILIAKKDTFFSQFNIMCQYIWMFHRNEYNFHLQFQPWKSQPGPLPLAIEDDAYYKREVTPEQTTPFPRPTCHFKYVGGNWKSPEVYRDILKRSICFAGGFELCQDVCKYHNSSTVRKQMFYFDNIDWRWDSRCFEAQRKHYRDVAKYNSHAYSEVIRNACKEVDSLPWNP